MQLNPIKAGSKETYPLTAERLSGLPGAEKGPPIVMMKYADLRNLCHVHTCTLEQGASNVTLQEKLQEKFATQIKKHGRKI